MAYPIVVTWPSPESLIICPEQSGDAGPLTGSLPYYYPSSSGYDRSWRLLFTGDNVGVNFVVTGLNSQTLEVSSETVAGAFGTVVETANAYLSLISVVASAPYVDVGVSLGGYGNVWIKLDPHKKRFQASVLASIGNDYLSEGLVYDVFITNQMIETPTVNGMVNNIGSISPNLFPLNSAGTDTGQAVTIPSISFPTGDSQFFKFNIPCTAIVFEMGANDTEADTSTSITFTVLQEGIR